MWFSDKKVGDSWSKQKRKRLNKDMIFGSKDSFRSLNRSRILKFEKPSGPDPVRIRKFWNRSGVGKMQFRPPLVYMLKVIHE